MTKVIKLIMPALILLFIVVTTSLSSIPTDALNTGNRNNNNNSIAVPVSIQKQVTRIYQNISSLPVKVGPPPKGVYLSALTDFGGAEDEVTSQKIIWAYFSNNWGSGIKFPEAAVRAIHSVGVIPFIRMMPRTVFTDGVAYPVYTLQGFIDGKFDNDLKEWAIDAKRVGIPIMVEFGTEVNGK